MQVLRELEKEVEVEVEVVMRWNILIELICKWHLIPTFRI